MGLGYLPGGHLPPPKFGHLPPPNSDISHPQKPNICQEDNCHPQFFSLFFGALFLAFSSYMEDVTEEERSEFGGGKCPNFGGGKCPPSTENSRSTNSCRSSLDSHLSDPSLHSLLSYKLFSEKTSSACNPYCNSAKNIMLRYLWN